MASINKPVGSWAAGAVNDSPDVRAVQELLQAAAKKYQNSKLDPKGVDGAIAKPPKTSDTVSAIYEFQASIVKMAKPDGRIDPGGTTWNALNAIASEDSKNLSGTGNFFFPFSKVPSYSWVEAPRCFGANRKKGKRAHAGCDLYFPFGTVVHSVADGVVVFGPELFYCETSEIQIDHGTFIVRYGEVQQKAMVKKGDKVKAGQPIARVGHLVGINVPSDMLHFEMYSKESFGKLTVRSGGKMRGDGVPFERRSDLMDPTQYLNKWKSNLPK